MDRMSDEERKQYDEAMAECHKEEIEQYAKDRELLEKIKLEVSAEHFENIKAELEESVNPSNYRIVYEPIGTPQHESEGDYTIWVDQSGGYFGDDYSGTVCIELSIRKYLMWDYWM